MGKISSFFQSLFGSQQPITESFTSEGLSSRDDAVEALAKAYNILAGDQDAIVEASVRAKNLQLQNDLIKAVQFEDIKSKDTFKFQEYNDKLLLNQLYASDIRPSGISNNTLRSIAFRSTLVSSIIKRRKNQMQQFAVPQRSRYDIGFRIKPKSGESPTLRQEEDIKRLTDALVNLGFMGYDPLRGTFKEFMGMVINDTLTFDAMCLERIWSKSGEVCAFKAIDAGSIIPKFDQSIQDFKYEEYIEGQLENTYDRKHLVYYVRNRTTDRRWLGFGMSELESLINVVTCHLYAEEYNKRILKNGHHLNGIVNLKGQVSRAQFQEFRRQFFSFLTGTENTSKVALINAPQGIEINSGIRNPQDLGYATMMDLLIKQACAQFLMDPVELNFFVNGGASQTQNSVGNLSAQEFRIKYSKDAGLRPLLSSVAEFINKAWLETISDEYELCFEGLDIDSPKERQDYLIKSNKYRTLNEVRAEEGLPPLDDDLGLVIDNSGYIQVLMAKINKASENQNQQVQEDPQDQNTSEGEELPIMTEDQIKTVGKYLKDNDFSQEESAQVLDAIASGALSWEDFVEATGYGENTKENEEQPHGNTNDVNTLGDTD